MPNQHWIIISFVVYFVLIISMSLYFRKSSSLSGFLLGGRSLGPVVGALSAQASDMSAWLLMGLPGVIYTAGTQNAWIAVGLIIGTVLNWLLIAKRLRRYTIVAGDAITLPSYFENRFQDKTQILKIVSAAFITFFFTVYTASFFRSSAILLQHIFPGLDLPTAALIGAVFIIIYTFIGGFLAISYTDVIMGSLMFLAITLMPMIALFVLGGWSGVTEGAPAYFFRMTRATDGGVVPLTSIASGLAWGLGYFGMPHILLKFMAIKREKDFKPAAMIGISWVILALFASVMLGLIGRAFIPGLAAPETIFIEMAQDLFLNPGAVIAIPVIGGVFLTGMFAAVKSTADSQLLVTSSALTNDLYAPLKKTASQKHLIWVSRLAILLISAIAFFLAVDPNAGVMVLVAIAWAGLGSAFGPLVILTLYWKRVNFQGAIAGIVVGALTVITWVYVPLVNGYTWAEYTNLFALLPGFVLSFLSIVIVTLLTPAPAQAIIDQFEEVQRPLEEQEVSELN
ncbi:MAG: sodium/proline symporter [Defluviitaleaceae bacterium]|nr:sodium/proline symporter [Defluviitaleaceae bacterium]